MDEKSYLKLLFTKRNIEKLDLYSYNVLFILLLSINPLSPYFRDKGPCTD